jgi:hypothetical protein
VTGGSPVFFYGTWPAQSLHVSWKSKVAGWSRDSAALTDVLLRDVY